MSLKFGTSGVRGLVTDFTQIECSKYVAAFIDLIENHKPAKKILIAGDLRESTPLIKQFIINSLSDLGLEVLDGGIGPTPALAWACSRLNVCGIMVTGSHIPADRNGIKFYFPEGEILKDDEVKIATSYASAKTDLSIESNPSGSIPLISSVDINALFAKRYVDAFPNKLLVGMKIGFYEHSSVGRDLFPEILRQLGAEVYPFARSSTFQAVDTEAVENIDFMNEVIQKNKLDLVVSTDGDSDRPLVVTDAGKLVAGEILGLLTSIFLGINAIVYPVSCSTLVSNSTDIKHHSVTKIGSPFVLGEMLRLQAEDNELKLAGFEANGGYLLGSKVLGLAPLMTRDSLLPILGLLLLKKREGCSTFSELMKSYSGRTNLSGLVRNFPVEKAAVVLARFKAESQLMGLNRIKIDELDGVRVTLEDSSVVHLRPSGNAPEFRIYIEAFSDQQAALLLDYFKTWIVS